MELSVNYSQLDASSTCNHLIYADDTMLYCSSDNVDLIFNRLEATLKIVKEWSYTWKMNFSVAKTQAMFFFHTYALYIRPRFEYASPAWNAFPGYLIDNLEKLQRREMRIILGYSYRTELTPDDYEALKLHKLIDRRNLALCCYGYKLYHGLLPRAFSPLRLKLAPRPYPTRQQSRLTVPNVPNYSSRTFDRSPALFAVKLLNLLPFYTWEKESNISKLKDTQIKNANAQNVSNKRMYEEDSKPFASFKKPKINEAKIEKNNLPGNFFDKKPQSSSMIGTNSSSDEDEEVENEEKNIEKPSPVAGLPSNFFDENAPKSIITDEENAESQTQHVTNKVEDLPEGFFDDPIVDAKVRHVEYKDAMDEEWEKFQKVISTESTVSQAIMDEDIEESKAEREIDEIDEQMHNWSRVQNLQMKKDKIANSAPPDKMDESELSLSADEQEYEEFLDWRSKKVR
ncbi:Zinc finger protein 830 [Nymphon striatum]|nr:Zinc finger protein 830 [Nymphon striatum]